MNAIWKILDIEETKDRNAIKTAYRKQLTTVNPEDDAEGFKSLRSAYEEAVAWANSSQAEDNEEKEELSPADLWLKEVEEVYNHFSKRVDPYRWEELINQDICMNLDTSNEVKEKLLYFLMDNFRLPHKVWVCLDEFFHFTEEKEELYEKYPKDFIDFIERAVTNEDFLDYSLFDGDDDSDYDSLIRSYYQLKNMVDEEKSEDIPKLLSECKDYFIYHPYIFVEEARYHSQLKEFDKALDIIRELYETNGQDSYILYCFGDILFQAGQTKEAYEEFEKLLKMVPTHYSGKLGLAECCFANGEYEKAKDLYLDLLETYSRDTYANDGMIKVNEILIDRYQKEFMTSPDNRKLGLELGWCLYQNGKYGECVDLLDKITPDEEHELEYCNLKGRTLLFHNEYQRALEYLPKWLEGLLAIEDNDTPENLKKRKRIGYAYFTIASAYSEITGNGKKENLETALEYVDKAILNEKDSLQRLGYQNHKAAILYHLNRYEDCVDVCDQLIAESEYYYPAFVQRQEAYYEMRHYQDVIDDFYRAVAIYTQDAQPYLLAIKTFLEFDKYEDALNIIERAEQEKVSHDRITYYKVKCLRCTAKSAEDTNKAYRLLKELKEHVKGNSHTLDRCGDPWFEGALCKKELNELAEAMKEIDTAIKYNPAEAEYLYCKGNIYFDSEKYQEALNIYKQLEKEYSGNENLIFKLGRVYDMLNDRQAALNYYEKVLQLYPEHVSVHHYIAEIYEAMGEEKDEISFYEKSLPHRTKQIEIDPNDYYYIERGLLYAELERFEEAINDYKKAIELNPESPYPYNNIGIAYKYLEQYDEAITYYKKAVELLEYEKTCLPYNNLAACYIILKDYKSAENCYIENLRLFPSRESSYTLLAELYRRMKLYDKAVQFYEDAMVKIPQASKQDILLDIAETYEEKGNDRKAEAFYKKAMKADNTYSKPYYNFAKYCIYRKYNPRRAVKLYKKAIEVYKANHNDDKCDYWYSIGVAYYYQADKKKAAEALQKSLDLYRTKFKSIERYLSFNGYEPSACYTIGCIYYYLGDIKKAGELFQRMNSCRKCKSCKTMECFEAFIGKGLILEAEGAFDKAVKYYEETLKYDCNSTFCKFLLNRLKKRK